MPMSHNAIESLAVGTVPVIEYPELFVPNLEDAGACIPFSGQKEFEEKVRSCLTMEVNTRKLLKEKAVEYYDAHLCPSAVGPNLQQEVLDGPPSPREEVGRVTLIAGHESVDAFRSKPHLH
jgi:hypothetical protein